MPRAVEGCRARRRVVERGRRPHGVHQLLHGLPGGLPVLLLARVRRDAAHEEVRRAHVAGADQVQGLEVGQSVLHEPAVDHLPVDKDDELVEELEHLGGRLVDGGDDGALLSAPGAVLAAGDLAQQPSDAARHGRVQAAGGLVREEQRGVHQHLRGEAQAPPLSAGDAGADVPDERGPALEEPELLQELVDLPLLLGLRLLACPEAALEKEVLAHGET
mmetsp:Transcript_97686/g.252802  ORF Transcript_97686/g.252802 Transcript_97686/m.252802 type:complete len:218 (+) Transcript_97686:898-1551(+)